jgi:F-type H+-transporting ATPase subunit b
LTLSRLPLLFVLMLSFALTPGKACWALQTADQPASEQKPAADGQEPETGDNLYRHSPSVKTIGGWMHMDKERAATSFEYFNFALLAAGVLYGLAKVLPKTFRANREAIQGKLEEARTATQDANERLAVIEKKLGGLWEEIAAISKQAEKDSAEDEARIKASIEEERKRIVDGVGKDIAAASSAAQRELKRFAASLAVERATQKLSLTEEDDRALMQEFVSTLGKHTNGRGEA